MVDPRGDRLKRTLIQCCYWYYVKTKPLIEDQTYDALIDELKGLEKAFGADSDSPTQKIWGDREEQYLDWMKHPVLLTQEVSLENYREFDFNTLISKEKTNERQEDS